VDGVIITGYLAGHNAARQAYGWDQYLVLPRSLAIGDFMAFVTEKLETGEALKVVYRMARGEYWERMQQIGLYTEDVDQVRRLVEEAGLSGILARPLKK
jgi:hypothetical protein